MEPRIEQAVHALLRHVEDLANLAHADVLRRPEGDPEGIREAGSARHAVPEMAFQAFRIYVFEAQLVGLLEPESAGCAAAGHG